MFLFFATPIPRLWVDINQIVVKTCVQKHPCSQKYLMKTPRATTRAVTVESNNFLLHVKEVVSLIAVTDIVTCQSSILWNPMKSLKLDLSLHLSWILSDIDGYRNLQVRAISKNTKGILSCHIITLIPVYWCVKKLMSAVDVNKNQFVQWHKLMTMIRNSWWKGILLNDCCTAHLVLLIQQFARVPTVLRSVMQQIILNSPRGRVFLPISFCVQWCCPRLYSWSHSL